MLSVLFRKLRNAFLKDYKLVYRLKRIFYAPILSKRMYKMFAFSRAQPVRPKRKPMWQSRKKIREKILSTNRPCRKLSVSPSSVVHRVVEPSNRTTVPMLPFLERSMGHSSNWKKLCLMVLERHRFGLDHTPYQTRPIFAAVPAERPVRKGPLLVRQVWRWGQGDITWAWSLRTRPQATAGYKPGCDLALVRQPRT